VGDARASCASNQLQQFAPVGPRARDLLTVNLGAARSAALLTWRGFAATEPSGHGLREAREGNVEILLRQDLVAMMHFEVISPVFAVLTVVEYHTASMRLD
jgi:hypothetical protein